MRSSDRAHDDDHQPHEGRAASDASQHGTLRGCTSARCSAIAAGLVVLELAVAGRYGFHRDELYFLACARHLAWGYVDQPPLVPAVARLATALFGSSVVGLRVLPGAGRWGRRRVHRPHGTRARRAAAELRCSRRWRRPLHRRCSPPSISCRPPPSTCSSGRRSPCSWFGCCAPGTRGCGWPSAPSPGSGLLNKYNVAFLLVGLAVGLLARRPRSHAAEPVALGRCGRWPSSIWSPNLVWNAQHDWAAFAMLHSLHQENSTLGASLVFIPAQFVVMGPVLVVLWVGGLRHSAAPPLRPTARCRLSRPPGAALRVTGAKPYYLAGMYFVLFAAGGIWAEGRLDARRRAERASERWVALIISGRGRWPCR